MTATADSSGCVGTTEAYSLQLRCFVVPRSRSAWPRARSAHILTCSSDCTLILACGDSGMAPWRFNDLWALQCSPATIPEWQQLMPCIPSTPCSRNDSGSSSSCTARSSAAAAVAGEHLVVFGGWDVAGLHPLACLEVFSLASNSWHSPLTTGTCPSPRGQPAAAMNAAGTCLYMFGGWDGQQHYNDLHRLQLDGWKWELLEPAASSTGGGGTGTAGAATAPLGAEKPVVQMKPCPRADHIMVCWNCRDGGIWNDVLVVFGGSSAQGLLNDTWLWDVNSCTWMQASCSAAAPCPRSSCAAAISRDTLLIHGGQTQQGVLHDMYLLHLSALTWLQVDLGLLMQPLCRHTMAVAGDVCWIFGGYDGISCTDILLQVDLQPVKQLQRSSIADLVKSMACCGASLPPSSSSESSKSSPSGGTAAVCTTNALHVVQKKAKADPLRLQDLLNAADVAAMPQWKQIRQLHQAALAAGCDTYIDPATGYTVFTTQYLQQRQCCGNKCRHCPHGWRNVRQLQTGRAQAANTPLDW